MRQKGKWWWLLALTGCLPVQASEITLYAAASLTNAMKDVVMVWQAAHPDVVVKTSFAASSTLAKQIEAGAPADIFVSADSRWMDYLADRQAIDRRSRHNLLGNTLVMIAPVGRPVVVDMTKGAPVPEFTGRLCMGEPGSVPAGVYGKQALQFLGWWPALGRRIVASEDVRTVLAFVERTSCPLGVVYETDARVSQRVRVVARFPDDSHIPVVYPVALLPDAPAPARELFAFLQSEQAAVVFRRHGFTVPKR